MKAIILVFGVAALAVPAIAQQSVGQPAGNFRLTDMKGRNVALSDYRGKTVVLEWTNPGCPFVRKHYDSGNMQRTQTAAVKDGAVWLTINSGAPGKQGYLTPEQAVAQHAKDRSSATDYLLDPKGVVGKGYAAKTTPHLYVVDPAGRLVYQGGIDDKPTADVADIKAARNHVTAALAEVKAGKPVSVAETRPYGCAVKYSDS